MKLSTYLSIFGQQPDIFKAYEIIILGLMGEIGRNGAKAKKMKHLFTYQIMPCAIETPYWVNFQLNIHGGTINVLSREIVSHNHGIMAN